MDKFFQGFFTIALCIALPIGICQAYAYFSPRYTQVDNTVFHASQQYNDGMLNQLREYESQYDGADTAQKRESVCAIIRQQYASYTGILPATSQAFLDRCNGEVKP